MFQYRYITWVDTVSSGDEWVEDTEDLALIESVGIVLKETAESLTLALSVAEDGMIRGYLCVPKQNIRKNECLMLKPSKDSYQPASYGDLMGV